MRRIQWLLLCLFVANTVTSQTSKTTCESDQVKIEDLNSVDKCKNKEAESTSVIDRRQVVLTYNSRKGRFFVKRRKEIAKAVEELNAKGIGNTNTDSNFSENLSVKKIENKALKLIDVDEIPMFTPCESSTEVLKCFKTQITQHIQENFEYPEEAIENNITGKVSVSFVFDKYGEIKILESVVEDEEDKILSDYTSELISKLPKFSPAKKNGKSVPILYEISLDFSL